MAEYYIAPKSSFDATADAIREKTGSQATIEWTEDGFADAVDDIQSGFSINDYLGHQLTGSAEFTDSTVSKISLQGQTGITALSFPNATTFAYVAASGFADMTGLISFYAPKAQKQPGNMLFNCSALTSVNLHGLTDTGNLLFNDCVSLVKLALPAVQNIYSQTVRGCSNLEIFDVLASNGFTNQNNMYGCAKLSTLIIRKNDGVPTLSNVNNFAGTPFASGGTGGTIYIPKSLYDHLGDGTSNDYRAATNWSTVYGYGTITWAKIEGSYYETHYGDDTEIPSS